MEIDCCFQFMMKGRWGRELLKPLSRTVNRFQISSHYPILLLINFIMIYAHRIIESACLKDTGVHNGKCGEYQKGCVTETSIITVS